MPHLYYFLELNQIVNIFVNPVTVLQEKNTRLTIHYSIYTRIALQIKGEEQL